MASQLGPDPYELWESSSSAWIALMNRGDSSRNMILDGAMLRLAGEVSGREVLDVGCGEGRFCRILSERGAQTTGVEPTPGLLREAISLDSRGRYCRAGGEELPFADGRFDLVVCYLVLIDIPDFRRAIQEMARATKPGGHLLVANLNSFTSTMPNAWIRDAEGKFSHLEVRDYFTERGQVVGWANIEIVNYHRPFEAYMQALLGVGLELTDFEEPRPAEEDVAKNPRLTEALLVPNFHVMRWRKRE